MRSGEGVLFIHGTASSGRVWKNLLAVLASEPPVQGFCGPSEPVEYLTPDIPGMGECEVPEGPLSFERWCDYFRGFASGRRLHLVGHSLGGAIAVHLAEEPWVLSVSLIAPATRAFCEARRASSRPGQNPGSILPDRPLTRLVAAPGQISREDARILREDYARAGRLLAKGLPWPPFPKAEAEYLRGKPVLLVYGERDEVISPAYFRQLARDLSAAGVTAEVVSLPGCGHIPQVEDPHRVAGILRSFWREACRLR
ncbi:MAG TPA: alpha/beta fold hydrolase [Firmicutes bacterium]|nr:alpha/beta fold hydrolase [Candidatus Fermentithermobacillaceae bacterium]